MRRRDWILTAAAAIAVVAIVGYAGHKWQLREQAIAHAHAITGGDPQKGRLAISAHSCGSCHRIPGVAGATGHVGPSLNGVAGEAYIAGRLANAPENLERWIVDPQGVDPGNAMPPTGVSPEEARDMAAYLYTLR